MVSPMISGRQGAHLLRYQVTGKLRLQYNVLGQVSEGGAKHLGVPIRSTANLRKGKRRYLLLPEL